MIATLGMLGIDMLQKKTIQSRIDPVFDDPRHLDATGLPVPIQVQVDFADLQYVSFVSVLGGDYCQLSHQSLLHYLLGNSDHPYVCKFPLRRCRTNIRCQQ